MDRMFSTCILPVATLSLLIATASQAQDFRIESEIFIGTQKQPVSENLTLFKDGRVYDFMLGEPNEVTVYDSLEEEFVLLDPKRRVQSTMTCDNILAFVARLKTTARRNKEPFIFDPYFDIAYDAKGGWVTLSSSRIIYRVKGAKPSDPRVVVQYRRFADWYARLNCMVPGSMPPFARIEMNKAMALRDLIPQRVELTINPRPRSTAKKVNVSSRHLVTWELSKMDHSRIATANKFMDSFSKVHYNDFRKVSSVATNRR